MSPGSEFPDGASRDPAALPHSATARLDQLRRTASWTSNLSVAEFAAIRGVGFEPVGQVMGSTVDALGNPGFGGCGRTGTRRTAVTGTGTAARSRWSGYTPRVEALYAGQRRAMGRLQQECRVLGGDGVVGVHLTHGPYPAVPNALQWLAIGTAVRSRGRTRPAHPFLTDLSGQEFAKLLHGRWVPCGIVLGIAIAVRHNDVQTWTAQRVRTNAEVPGYTEVVHEARGQVRAEIAGDAARQGAEGIVLQEMSLHRTERECPTYGGADSIVEAALIGAAVTRFDHAAPTAPVGIQVMRLDQAHERVVSRRLVDDDEENPWR